MIKKFEEFIKESYSFLNNVNPKLQEIMKELGDGETKSSSVESLDDSEYDIEKIKKDYPSFENVYQRSNHFTGEPLDDYVYIVYKDEDDEYCWEQLTWDEFDEIYR